LLAASNQDPAELVKQGRFREDFYYRLSGFTIHLPALREREEDVALLIHHYLRRFNRELGRQVDSIGPEALAALKAYSWPGNVRELQNVLKQALIQATGPILLPDFLPALSSEAKEQPMAADGQLPLEQFIEQRLHQTTDKLHEECIRWMEKTLLTKVLQHTGGNQVQAAQILGITRGSLRNKLRDLGITITRTVASGEESEE
jgi:two-component system nitrogen regulation response regulator GlnG